jgi:hypothetical protein
MRATHAIAESEVIPTVTAAQEPVTFLSPKYLTLKVLIERNPSGGVYDADTYIKFGAGSYTTSDPKVIAKLDKVAGVYRDTGLRYVCPKCEFKTRYAEVFAQHMSSAH